MTKNRKLNKIGHNDPCPCGSGKKYKKCHGNLSVQNQEVPLGIEKQIRNHIHRTQAREHQRKLQQGLGNPIQSEEVDGVRKVRVRYTEYSSRQWQTFPDFLLSYLTGVFEKDWFESERAPFGRAT